MPDPITLTPEEIAEYEQKASAVANAPGTPINPVKDLSADELAELSIKDPQFNLVSEFGQNKDLWGDPALVQKVADAHDALLTRGFKFADLPGPVGLAKEGVKGVAEMTKGLVKQAWNYASIPGVALADIAGTVSGQGTGFTQALLSQQEQRMAEAAAGTEAGMMNLAELGRKGVEKAERVIRRDRFTPEEKVKNLFSALGRTEVQEDIAKGRGAFSTAIRGEEAIKESEAKGYAVRPEEVQSLAAGDPFSLYLMGKGFGASGQIISKATPTVVKRGLAVAAEKAGERLEKVVGGAIQGAGAAGEITGKVATSPVAKIAGPAIVAGEALVTGRIPPLEHFITGGFAGTVLEKFGQASTKLGTGLKEFGKQVRGVAPVESSLAQLGRDILHETPAALGDVAHGAAFDIGLAAATAESPADTQSVGIGTAFGLLKGTARVGARALSGQVIAPRAYGIDKPQPSSGQFPALDAAHNTAFADLTPGQRARVNAVRFFTKGAAPDTDVFTGKDTESISSALQATGVDKARADQLAAQEGFFSTNLVGKDGNPHKVIIVKNVDAAPHESFHAFQDVLGEEANQAIDKIVKSEYARQWDYEGYRYARRLVGGPLGDTNWREVVLDFSGWGLDAAKEKIARDIANRIRNETGAEPKPADVAEMTKAEIGRRMDTALQNNSELAPEEVQLRMWRDVLTEPGEAAEVADRYIARELAAENFDMAFKHGLQAKGLAQKLAQKIANFVHVLGYNPLQGRVSQIGKIEPKFGVVEAVKGALPPVVEPVEAAAKAPPAAGGAQKAKEWINQHPTGDPQKDKAGQDIADSIGNSIWVSYKSAPGLPASEPASIYPERRAEVENARQLTNSERADSLQEVAPYDIEVRSNDVQYKVWSISNFNANLQKFGSWLAQVSRAGVDIAKVPYAVDAASGRFTGEGLRALWADAQTAMENLRNGFTSTGEEFIVPETVIARGGYQPVKTGKPAIPLAEDRADIINYLFNFQVPKSQRISPLHLKGQEVRVAAGRPLVEPAGGARQPYTAEQLKSALAKGAPATLPVEVTPGVSVEQARRPLEMNPFRKWVEQTATASKVLAPEVIEVNQRLNFGHIERTTPSLRKAPFGSNVLTGTANLQPREWTVEGIREGQADKVEVRAEDMAEARRLGEAQGLKVLRTRPTAPTEAALAQFEPSEDRRAIKMAAVRDRQTGKIYEGSWHGEALMNALTDSERLLSEEAATKAIYEGAADRFEDGFTTNTPKEFLNRDEAYQRAIELKQVKPEDYVRESGGYFDTTLESDAFAASRQFQPKPLEEEARRIAEMTPEEFGKWGQEAVGRGGYTKVALDVGLGATSQEFVDFLKSSQLKSAEEFKRGMASGNLEGLMAVANRTQFFREAYEAATGTGSAGFALRQKDPNTKFPFPQAEVTAQAQVGELTEREKRWMRRATKAERARGQKEAEFERISRALAPKGFPTLKQVELPLVEKESYIPDEPVPVRLLKQGDADYADVLENFYRRYNTSELQRYIIGELRDWVENNPEDTFVRDFRYGRRRERNWAENRVRDLKHSLYRLAEGSLKPDNPASDADAALLRVVKDNPELVWMTKRSEIWNAEAKGGRYDYNTRTMTKADPDKVLTDFMEDSLYQLGHDHPRDMLNDWEDARQDVYRENPGLARFIDDNVPGAWSVRRHADKDVPLLNKENLVNALVFSSDLAKEESAGRRGEIVFRAPDAEVFKKLAPSAEPFQPSELEVQAQPARRRKLTEKDLPEGYNPRESEHWLLADGTAIPAPKGHLEAAYEYLTKNKAITPDTTRYPEDFYDEMFKLGNVRYVLGQDIFIDGQKPSSYESLPLPLRRSIEQIAHAVNRPVVYNGKDVDLGIQTKEAPIERPLADEREARQRAVEQGIPYVPPEAQAQPPLSTEPEAVKEAAFRFDDTGRIFSGFTHYTAYGKAEQYALRELKKSPGQIPHSWGFITNDGKFLTPQEALKRAREFGQLSEGFRSMLGEGGLDSEQFNRERIDRVTAQAEPAEELPGEETRFGIITETGTRRPVKGEQPVLYVVRHGSTDFNNEIDPTKDKIRGHLNVPLNEKGMEEAKGIAKDLEGSNIVRIYTSDLDRTHDTAKEIAKTTGAEVIRDSRLRPWNLGPDIEGHPASKVLPVIDKYFKNPDTAPRGGETFNTFKGRFLAAYRQIQQDNPDDDAAIVTHYRNLRVLEAWQKAGATGDKVDMADILEHRQEPPASYKVVGKDHQMVETEPMQTDYESAPDVQMQPREMTEDEAPVQTRIAYKIFRTLPSKPGKIFPLFLGAKNEVPLGVWLEAELLPKKKGFALRPGWHSGELPMSPQLLRRDGTMDPTRVWAEVEIPVDVDWQARADESPSKDIKNEVPKGGSYKFKEMNGVDWNISGALKVNRILTNEEIRDILTKAGRGKEAGTYAVTQAQPHFSAKEFADELEKVRKGTLFGQTFNANGTVWQSPKEPVDIVTLASVNVPRGELTPEKVTEALGPFSQLLDQPGIAAGVFSFEKDGKPMVSVDLNVVVPQTHRANTVDFAKKNNQISIWDAAKGETVETGGTGETTLKTADEIASVLPELRAGKFVTFPAEDRSSVKYFTGDVPKISGTGPHGKTSLWDTAKYLSEENAKKGKLPPNDEDSLLKMAATFVKEAKFAYGRDKSAIGWYDAKLSRMKEILKQFHPELADENKFMVYKALLAINSNGQSIDQNLIRTDVLYDQWKKTGKFDTTSTWGGKASKSINIGLKNLSELIATKGLEGTREFLASDFVVGDLKKIGYKIPGELISGTVKGSVTLGPKIGSFYGNLNGDYSSVTMDRWFMRTFHRIDGTLADVLTSRLGKQIDAVLEAFKGKRTDNGHDLSPIREELYQVKQSLEEGTFDQEALQDKNTELYRFLADRYHPYSSSGFKERTPENTTTKNLYENLYTIKLHEAPHSGGERQWIRQVMAETQRQLKADGIDLTNADLQALLWYYEKELHAKFYKQVERAKPTDYAIAAERFVSSKRGQQPGPVEPGPGRAGVVETRALVEPRPAEGETGPIEEVEPLEDAEGE